MRIVSTVLVVLVLICSPLRADVKLPAIFGDHMVLQRDAKVPVWGWADANEAVTVTAGDVKANATTGADGKWTATLVGLKASDKPIDVIVAGKNSLTLHDVLVGDVWVCSGQSNMEFQLGGGKWGFGGAHNAETEIPKADHPTLRLFIVKKKIAFEPQTDCGGEWKVCTPETAPRFSAVGYFFGRDIMESQHIPVGMIGTYWGGTLAQAWTSLEALKAHPKLSYMAGAFERLRDNLANIRQRYETEVIPKWQKDRDAWEKDVNEPYHAALRQWAIDTAKAHDAGQPLPPKPKPAKESPRRPGPPDSDPNTATVLTNGMIAPIVPYAIKGAIWYQGEANAGQPKEYETLFPVMITDWRTRWGEGDFPFFWVQLANFMARNPEPTQTADGWPGLRDAQSKTLKLPNTGQAVIIDIGQGDDIHPKDKMDVGRRLSLAARHVAYGENLVYSGPTYDSMQIAGDKVRINFKNVGSGLTIAAAPTTQPDVAPEAPATQLKGFAIAGEDHKFVWATAVIEPMFNAGASDTVYVSSPEVKEPKAVRYGWADNPAVNLYNKEGLPASPFRTDNWSNPTAAPVPPTK